VKLGCCAGIDKALVLYNAGYDFIECTVTSLQPEASEQEFKQILKMYESSPIPVEACNIFLPGDIKVVGEEVNVERIRNYLSRALERVKRIGADTVVFGSGRSRSLPDGFSREKGEEQILSFLKMTADVAEPLDITIVIEPLNKKETNIITSVPEAVDFAKKVNRRAIKVLADFYHMDEENEALSHIEEYKDYIRHIHVADTGRKSPGTGTYPYEEFFKQIQYAQYDQRISIECGWDDFDNQVKQSLTFLKDQLGVAK